MGSVELAAAALGAGRRAGEQRSAAAPPLGRRSGHPEGRRSPFPPLPSHPIPLPFCQDFYGLTLESLADSKNERLWFKTNMKLANLWVGLGEGGQAARVLRELHASCRGEDGRDDLRKGTQVLEV